MVADFWLQALFCTGLGRKTNGLDLNLPDFQMAAGVIGE